MPATSVRGAGDGTMSITASSSLRTPKFVRAEPKKTGVDSAARNALTSSVAPTSVSSASSSVDCVQASPSSAAAREAIDELLGGLGRTPCGAGEAGVARVSAVDHAPEVAGQAHGPGDRRGHDAELLLDLVEQLERVTAGAIPLVDERQQGELALAAHVEQLEGLGLDALGRVEHHHGGVGRRQHAVGVLGEVTVAGRVEQVDDRVAVGELHHRRGDRDAPLLLELHPVRSGGATTAAGFDGAGLGREGAAVQEELLGEGGLARVGVADDGERTTARRFLSRRKMHLTRLPAHTSRSAYA